MRHIEFQIQENGVAPRSFEEAIINVNREKFGISEDATVIEYNEDEIGKTDFALRLLVDAQYSDYSVPTYIKNGLVWLDKQSKIPETVPVVTKLKKTRKVGFVYHHTCEEVPVPLMNEIRVGHTNYMTKERWEGLTF